MAKIYKCDVCSRLIESNEKVCSPHDIVNTGGHSNLFEQLYFKDTDFTSVSIKTTKDICETCVNKINNKIKKAIHIIMCEISKESENTNEDNEIN